MSEGTGNALRKSSPVEGQVACCCRWNSRPGEGIQAWCENQLRFLDKMLLESDFLWHLP